MTDRERINFFPTEEDARLIEEQIAYHGGDAPGVLRRGLRAAKRELDILQGFHAEAKKAASTKGKSSGKRSRS